MKHLYLYILLIIIFCSCHTSHTPVDWSGAYWIVATNKAVSRSDAPSNAESQVKDENNPIFKRTFEINHRISSAKMLVSALGIYDLWINGVRVGSTMSNGRTAYDELKPGWTDYNNRVFYNYYDIADYCHEGTNEVVALVTPGWMASSISRKMYSDLTKLAFIAKIEIKYRDGSCQQIVTDEDWTCQPKSPILSGHIYHGEYYDARRPLTGQSKEYQVKTYNYPGKLEPFQGPTIRVAQDRILRPISITVYDDIEGNGSEYGKIKVTRQIADPTSFQLHPGEIAIVDFGQNCAGIPEFLVRGESGTVVNMRFGEMLNDCGDPSHNNDGPEGSLYTANLRNAKAQLGYVLNGAPEGELYSPISTYFGYRYCEITVTGNVNFDSLNTLPISSVNRTTGAVATDNKSVNKLFSNLLWSQLSNFISIPTDCPQRNERLGWTADAHLFAPVAMYNADMGPFYRKWLGDIRDSQRDDGAYSDVSPLSLTGYGTGGWADAGIIVPWQIYVMTGDKEVLSEHYESMEKYMSWLSTLSEKGLSYPGGTDKYGDCYANDPVDKRFVSQAFYYNDAVLMAKMSRVLDFPQKATDYDVLAKKIKAEIQAVYFDANGLKEPTQGGCVLSLYFNLYETSEQKRILVDTLVGLIKGYSNRMNAGFISSAYILQVLCDNGQQELAYQLLTQHRRPSWLYMVDHGATTMWEQWHCYVPEEGFSKVLANSFNHIILGSFASWMYSHMAGISPCEETPGFAKVIFKPYIDTRTDCQAADKINLAYAYKSTDWGDVSAEWQIAEGNQLVYTVTVPDGITGEVHFPVETSNSTVYINNEPNASLKNVKSLGYVDGRQVYSVKRGTYRFSTAITDDFTISQLPQSPLHTWPNPTFDYLHFSVDGEIDKINISAPSGLVPGGSLLDESTIDVSHLSPGLYLLTITTEDKCYVAKFIKL